MEYNKLILIIKRGISLSKYDIYLEKVKELNAKGMINKEIADELGIDSRRVGDLLKKLSLTKNESIKEFFPSDIQNEVLVGSIIGDGCIFKCNNSKNYRFVLAHSLKQEKYFLKKYEIIKDCMKTEPKYCVEYHKRAKKEYSCIKVQSRVNQYFTKMYQKWYKEGKKIIADEIFDITPMILSVKYYDDGNYIRGAGAIAMNDYTIEDIDKFREAIYCKFNILTTVQSRKIVYIPKKEFISFKDIVLPFATSDVLYKLGELLES